MQYSFVQCIETKFANFYIDVLIIIIVILTNDFMAQITSTYVTTNAENHFVIDTIMMIIDSNQKFFSIISCNFGLFVAFFWFWWLLLWLPFLCHFIHDWWQSIQCHINTHSNQRYVLSIISSHVDIINIDHQFYQV